MKTEITSNQLAKLEKTFQSASRGKNIHGGCLRIENGKGEVVFEGQAGNFTQQSRYFIASTTKIYTTSIIMKLRSEGLLELDDQLSKFYKDSEITGISVIGGVDFSQQITVRQLLAHTSGLADYFSGKNGGSKSAEEDLMAGKDMPWTLESALTMVRSLKPKFKPGAPGKAYYSDTNYQLLGGIIERLRGKKIGEVFQQEIFGPLGLKNTYLFEVGQQDSALIPLYYRENSLYIPQAMASFGPDGGIVSNSQDSARFLRAFFQGEIFPEEYLFEMTAEYNRIFFPLRYGVGLMMFQLPAIFTLFRKFPELLGHSGLSGAFSFYAPKLDLYFTGSLNQIAARSASYQMLVKCMQALS